MSQTNSKPSVSEIKKIDWMITLVPLGIIIILESVK